MTNNNQEEGGPGYRRMIARLGAAGYKALCDDTLARKDAALNDAMAGRAPAIDRASYKGYPEPKPSKRSGRGARR